jgi:AcrR family transcriptional regulator
LVAWGRRSGRCGIITFKLDCLFQVRQSTGGFESAGGDDRANRLLIARESMNASHTPQSARPRRTQEERSAETRARLLDATVESLIEIGYARTTTTAVCARAGLSRGAQLHHFPTKSELVIAAVAHLAMRRARDVREEAKRLADLDDRIEAALELIWTSFAGPLFYAALEVWVAARTDAELHESLFGFERAVGKAMAQLWQEFAGESQAEKSRFDDVLELTFYVMRGMALQKILKDNDTERRRLYEVWKRLVAQALKDESLWSSDD